MVNRAPALTAAGSEAMRISNLFPATNRAENEVRRGFLAPLVLPGQFRTLFDLRLDRAPVGGAGAAAMRVGRREAGREDFHRTGMFVAGVKAYAIPSALR